MILRSINQFGKMLEGYELQGYDMNRISKH